MTKTLPLISICVINYNGVKFLEQSITSILNQTYKNIEIVFCDDASTDNSIELFESLVKEATRVKIVRKYSRENGGVEKNMLTGLRAFTGDFVCNMDGDDILLPDHIETLYSFISSTGADISSTNHMQFTDTLLNQSILSIANQRQDLEKLKPVIHSTKDVLGTLFLQKQLVPFAYWHRLYRRQPTKRVAKLPDSYFKNSDSAFSLAQLCEAKSIAYIDYPTYLYRYVENSVSHKSWYAYVSKKTLRSLDKMSNFYGKKNTTILGLNRKRNHKAVAWMIAASIHEGLGYKEYLSCIKTNVTSENRALVGSFLDENIKSLSKQNVLRWCFLKNYFLYYIISKLINTKKERP